MPLARPRLVCGLDEAGRGALAGPIVVAAVVLAEDFAFERIAPGAVVRDSKLLSGRQRLRLLELIEAHCVAVEVTAIGVEQIDAFGIDWANTEGFRRLIRRVSADAYVVDGRWRLDGLGGRAGRVECRIRADETVPAALAAGVVAKVRRDEIMRRLDVLEPGYGWSANTGHGTAAHIDAVRRLGPTAHHRRQFVATALAGRRPPRRRRAASAR